MYLETERLILRPWQEDDREPFARLNADPEVMRYFPSALTREKSDALIDIARERTREDGFCFSPVEEKATGRFLGFVGLSRPRYASPLPFDPCIEIGWRMDRSVWGQGYATEAARAWIGFGFETLGLNEIVSFTAVPNQPSQRVMQRLGMRRNAEDDFFSFGDRAGTPPGAACALPALADRLDAWPYDMTVRASSSSLRLVIGNEQAPSRQR
ncbi:GNAT family N-acetyltransferase [Roseibium aggregatum]|uniref:GNAT family N-acetyltransferase n=1 Tax=Roseibium aggregatum TaxID=187304 RepID=UPI002E295E61|nr:GNAT family N-acetyltransferase [Roseibium aggregatum]